MKTEGASRDVLEVVMTTVQALGSKLHPCVVELAIGTNHRVVLCVCMQSVNV